MAAWETLMFAIIGIVVVAGAILGGYLMEHSNVKVLIQPAELLTYCTSKLPATPLLASGATQTS